MCVKQIMLKIGLRIVTTIWNAVVTILEWSDTSMKGIYWYYTKEGTSLLIKRDRSQNDSGISYHASDNGR